MSDKKKPAENHETENKACPKAEASSEASSQMVSRTKQKMQRQKSRRNVNGSGQRSDLGTVTASKSPNTKEAEKSLVGGFVGSISSIFFGRKGGLL